MSKLRSMKLAPKVKAKLPTRISINMDEKDIALICDAVFDAILDTVKDGEDVVINNFGKFHPRFMKGKIIKKTGFAWMKGKEYEIKDRLRLGFEGAPKAHETVSQLMHKYAI